MALRGGDLTVGADTMLLTRIQDLEVRLNELKKDSSSSIHAISENLDVLIEKVDTIEFMIQQLQLDKMTGREVQTTVTFLPSTQTMVGYRI